jgi:hypothetical protein
MELFDFLVFSVASATGVIAIATLASVLGHALDFEAD